MTTSSLLQRLSAHRTVGSLPEDQIVWVAAHGELRRLVSGDVLTRKDGQVEGLHVVLEGHLAIHVDRGAGRRKIMEWRSGDVTGLMPYSRLVAPPGDVVAEEPSEVVTIHRRHMPEMIRECHELTELLVHVMVDRARHFTSSYLHDEKLVSLGKLAAGLAHELNNPASAITRNARALSAGIIEADAAARLLGSAGLAHDQVATLEKVRDASLAGGRFVLSPLEQEQREDSIARWLTSHNADTRAAEALAEADISPQMLEQIAASIPPAALNAGLGWLAAGCATRRLIAEVQQASGRISDLVGAIKGFTQMDRAAVPEPVAIGQGLADTVVVLRAKAKSKSVGLSMNVDAKLPSVRGYASELNQVWANLIDNALDAVSEGGRVELTATTEGSGVVVRVVDDGPGVPAEIRDRIFDPFFTTKPTGKGTGLGLDIVRRLVLRHNGQIEVDSTPGRTEFRVILPVADLEHGADL